MKDTDLAYIAGIVDGEGCVRINKTKAYKCQGKVTPTYNARIQIRMTDEEAIRFIAQTLGGWYYPEKKAAPHRKKLYCYQASGKAAENILRTILPYLRVKKEQALTVLALRNLQSVSRSFKTKVIGQRNFPNVYGTRRIVDITCLSDEYIDLCEGLYQKSKELNRTGDPMAVLFQRHAD